MTKRFIRFLRSSLFFFPSNVRIGAFIKSMMKDGRRHWSVNGAFFEFMTSSLLSTTFFTSIHASSQGILLPMSSSSSCPMLSQNISAESICFAVCNSSMEYCGNLGKIQYPFYDNCGHPSFQPRCLKDEPTIYIWPEYLHVMGIDNMTQTLKIARFLTST